MTCIFRASPDDIAETRAGRLCAGCTFAPLLSSQAENIDRKDFTVEERVAIGEFGERRGKPSEKVENFPRLETGKTRDNC